MPPVPVDFNQEPEEGVDNDRIEEGEEEEEEVVDEKQAVVNSTFAPPKEVQVDGLVVLKIIKHAKEISGAETTSGFLVGLSAGRRLEVTDGFPYPQVDPGVIAAAEQAAKNNRNKRDRDFVRPELSAAAEAGFQRSVMTTLRESMNADNFRVGRFVASQMGAFLTKRNVARQYAMQRALPHSVLIVYDPTRTRRGHLSIRAFRLTDAFMELYTERLGKRRVSSTVVPLITLEDFADSGVSSNNIFESLQLKIHNSHLVHGFLYELRQDKSLRCDFSRLDATANPVLSKTVRATQEAMDLYGQQQSTYQFHQRFVGRHAGAIADHIGRVREQNQMRATQGLPEIDEDDSVVKKFGASARFNRLESLLLAAQVEIGCSEVNAVASQTLGKTHLFRALQKEGVDAPTHEEKK